MILINFEQATKLISGECYTTLSFVMSLYLQLSSFIEKKTIEGTDAAKQLIELLKAAHKVIKCSENYCKVSFLFQLCLK